MVSGQTQKARTVPRVRAIYCYAILMVVVCCALYLVFQDGLNLMVSWWERDEYSHGYMIPLVAGFLLWQRIPRLLSESFSSSWWGVVGMLAAIMLWALGEISSLYTIVQYAFLGAIYALALSLVGWRGFWVALPALAYLIFMIPLPNFLYFNLSQQLQLISSEIGVFVVRLFGVSVYLEGNVIDLGTYKLQVVEACSGLRYLFPLMSFGFLIAAVYRGPFWHKVVIFVSTAPITILMNSFRIGVIGVTVEHWGIAAAEGFLHDFEGWVVFMGCLAVLFVIIWFLNLFPLGSATRPSLWDRLDLNYPSVVEVKAAWGARESGRVSRPFLGAVIILVLAVPFSFALIDREDAIPERNEFSRFPLLHEGWAGRESALEEDVLNELKLTDYITASFRRSSDGIPVQFYVAYYASQRKGASIHSPRSCLPGGGWQIKEHTIEPVAQPADGIPDFSVNRFVIQQGESRMLVYYWFQQRGRVITNEYLAKWYMFVDALTRQRTDGALVRLITMVPPGSDLAEAEQRLVDFANDFGPLMKDYVPE